MAVRTVLQVLLLRRSIGPSTEARRTPLVRKSLRLDKGGHFRQTVMGTWPLASQEVLEARGRSVWTSTNDRFGPRAVMQQQQHCQRPTSAIVPQEQSPSLLSLQSDVAAFSEGSCPPGRSKLEKCRRSPILVARNSDPRIRLTKFPFPIRCLTNSLEGETEVRAIAAVSPGGIAFRVEKPSVLNGNWLHLG